MLITLTTQQIDRIHEATLRILWETGIVLDHAGAVQRLRRGFAVDDETLAVELTRAAMDGDRNYLAQRHTVQHMRRGEVWASSLAVVEGTWHAWREAGRSTAAERAHQRAEELLRAHFVPELTVDQDKALQQIITSVK